jgi:hypothetical protein
MRRKAEHVVVLGSGVVPAGDGILFPAEAHRELQLLDPLDRHVQQRL